MMPGVDFGEFQKAFVDAFNPTEPQMLVRVRLNERLEVIVAPGEFDYIAIELLSWAERQGMQRVIDLARRVSRPPAERATSTHLEKFGMAPMVSCQEAGAAVQGAPELATAAGLEALVRPRLKIVDMDVSRLRMAQVEGQGCQVEFDGDAKGTGFMVGQDLVLTNYHVMQGPIEGKTPSIGNLDKDEGDLEQAVKQYEAALDITVNGCPHRRQDGCDASRLPSLKSWI
jgi:hypothetical protein